MRKPAIRGAKKTNLQPQSSRLRRGLATSRREEKYGKKERVWGKGVLDLGGIKKMKKEGKLKKIEKRVTPADKKTPGGKMALVGLGKQSQRKESHEHEGRDYHSDP